jgi:type I restriction enzyme R subunit
LQAIEQLFRLPSLQGTAQVAHTAHEHRNAIMATEVPNDHFQYQSADDSGKRPSRLREGDIEQRFMRHLRDQNYVIRDDIRDQKSLEDNFRRHFEALNHVTLTDNEFSRLLASIIKKDTYEASQTLREVNTFHRDDETPLYFTLVNTKDWCKNEFEAVRQLRVNTEYSHHRYDVILLINGVPCVQIELKTLSVTPRRAMEQIVEYKKTPGNGYDRTLLCFMQIFVVSNYYQTFYFANNNNNHFTFDADERFLPVTFFADQDNRKITHLAEFTERFLQKCWLAKTISQYMVLVATERKLMMLRPYQVYAVQNIVSCVNSNSGNGYIWHTTGSGKTLTSFKTATLLKKNDSIHKCVFVVDRKDLDRQTRDEFNRFQEKCVEENTNTKTLVDRLCSEDHANKVIVTTIQKLGLALDESSERTSSRSKNGTKTYKQLLEPLRDKRMVFIFDECHRSQFGENHQAIKEFFPKAQLFGFTGTPIFEENASLQKVEGVQATLRTTKDLFEKQLHAYTITHAIEDQNVLRFHIDYFRPDGASPPKPGMPVPKRAVIDAILTKHDAATGARRYNAILATASIDDAIEYHALFKVMQGEQQMKDPAWRPLNVACIFSPPANGNADIRQIQEDLPQELSDNEKNPDGKREALQAIIADYNAMFGSNHRISEFDLYYQDIQKRIKDHQWPNSEYPRSQKIDITIVVDMLLTGFDAKYLNTLYVDKNLRHHGLIQAFSRTNRVLNATKPSGNILDFRQQQDAVDTAIRLFSGHQTDEQARNIWLVDPAPTVIDHLRNAITELRTFMESHGQECSPQAVSNLRGTIAKTGFVRHFKNVQRLVTQLDQYTDLSQEERATIEALIPEETLRGFRGQYLETARILRAAEARDADGLADADDISQLDFEFVLFASAIIDYDYIMGLIAKYSAKEPGKATMTREQLIGLISADAKFSLERDDIAEYIGTLKAGEGLSEVQIREGYARFQQEKRAKELVSIATRVGISTDALKAFVDNIVDRLIVDGEALTNLFEPLDLGWQDRVKRELLLMSLLIPLLRKRTGGRDISGLSAYETQM